MAEQNRAAGEPARGGVARPAPVSPSDGTERPPGLAFDVEAGTELPGVPAGEQAPGHPGAADAAKSVRERGEGVGLDVPGE